MKEQIAKYILLTIVVFFLVMLFANLGGYYETKEQKAKTLTEEQIKLFEKDIEQGKSIDVKKYTKEIEKDYTSDLSNNIYKASLEIEKLIDGGVKRIFKTTKKIVND